MTRWLLRTGPAFPAFARCVVLGLACAAPAAALDQLNLILPNPRHLPMGDSGSIEAGAVVARTSGAAAAWYNPAGLAGQERREVAASASVFDYQRAQIDSPYGDDERRTLTIIPGFAGASQPIDSPGGDQDERWGFGLMVATPVQWETSVAQQEVVDTATGPVSYGEAYDTAFRFFQPTLAVGWTHGANHRFGVAGSLLVNQLSSQRSVTLTDAGNGLTATSLSQIHGLCVLLRMTLGWQWQGEDGWTLGATAAMPGIRVWRSGNRTDSVVDSDAPAGRISVANGDEGHYPLDLDAPAEITFGVARGSENWALELDLAVGLPTPVRDVFPSIGLKQVTTTGGTTAYDTLDIPAVTTSRRLVLNAALGWAHRITDTWWGHAGMLSDRSTVHESALFTPIDLWSAVAGISVRSENSLFTVGAAYTWAVKGTAESADLATGESTESNLRIRIIRVIVGTSYRF